MTQQEPNQHNGTPHTIGQKIGGAIDHAVGSVSAVGRTVGQVGRLVGSVIHLPGLNRRSTRFSRSAKPGDIPGIEHLPEAQSPPAPDTVHIRCMDYAPDKVVIRDAIPLEELLNQTKPDWARVRWINIDGLHPYTVRLISQTFNIHPLAAEDILHTPQRPRFEPYDNDVFLLTRMLRLCEGKLLSGQVSLFMNEDTVITFQETRGDVWDPIRKRIQTDGSRLRKYDASYLVYALLDAMVDHYFPLLEHYSDRLDDLEDQILDKPDVPVLNTIHAIKSELSVLRRVIWPMRKVASDLRQCDLAVVSEVSRTYLRDVDEHCLQIVEVIETFRETAAGLTDLHMSVISNRMNETMKVLTIMASLFIPITFMAGVYGMNFDWMPELRWRYGYPVFLLACVLVVAGLLMYFRHKGWLGGRSKEGH